MAKIGNVFIAGKEEFQGKYLSGVTYLLSSVAKDSHIYVTNDNRWQVELSKGSRHAVARSEHAIPYEKVLADGFTAIQKALDILSVKTIYSLTLSDPSSLNICVHQKAGKTVLSSYGLSDFPIDAQMTITRSDASGNVIPEPPPPEPQWHESFRYYRLSQCSSDLFEAYRNLFLAFEAVLNTVSKKRPGEGEGDWLKKALGEVNKKLRLANFAPSNHTDPVAYIIKTQYRDVRCALQHAKSPKAGLPHATLTPEKVNKAYDELLRLWRAIATLYLNVPGGGMLVTYGGFKIMMDRVFDKDVSQQYTTDKSPIATSSSQVSESGDEVHEFGETTYLSEVTPGVVRLISVEDINANVDRFKIPFFRTGILFSGKLFGLGVFEDGLNLLGIDEWESIQDIRLVNASMPKMKFNT